MLVDRGLEGNLVTRYIVSTDAYTDGFDGNARNTVLFIIDGWWVGYIY